MRLSPSRPPLACWIAGVVLVALSGCATTQRPVLYPNAKYKQVGEQTARHDIDDCMRNGSHPASRIPNPELSFSGISVAKSCFFPCLKRQIGAFSLLSLSRTRVRK